MNRSLMQKIFNKFKINIENERKKTGSLKNIISIHIMVAKLIVPPAGLLNQGLRKKLNAKH